VLLLEKLNLEVRQEMVQKLGDMNLLVKTLIILLLLILLKQKKRMMILKKAKKKLLQI
jgi:hypothetical protein